MGFAEQQLPHRFLADASHPRDLAHALAHRAQRRPALQAMTISPGRGLLSERMPAPGHRTIDRLRTLAGIEERGKILDVGVRGTHHLGLRRRRRFACRFVSHERHG
ncbi:hypothetical protein [Mycobacterium sp. SP-6446]|uniref:hypothetical protein n=1 Tax=Mycobacterium sp. SP-6446 TaxID=1834162 RepID=UPI0011157198|nr:hypothetical protein [Mycobacterium sp. SP-6446]